MPLNLDFSLPQKKKEEKAAIPTKRKIDLAHSKQQIAIKKRKFRSDLFTLEDLRETLFEPDFKKEEDIIITFKVFTKEMIRISDDGKFGIKYNEIEKNCTLYHYKNPITFDYNLEMEAILRTDSEIKTYSNISIQFAEDIMIAIVREEYALRKVSQLNKIDDSLQKAQEEREKLELELEKADEEFLDEEELENIYLVPNSLMEDLFGKGLEDTIEILESQPIEEIMQEHTARASSVSNIKREEVTNEQASNISQSNVSNQSIQSGGRFTYLPKKSS